MSRGSSITTQHILSAFSEEIVSRSGTVLDVFEDGIRLFARSVLPAVEEVKPRDRLQGGVALRATGSEVWVHPYLFRQVCRNGAIMAQARETRHHADLDRLPEEDAFDLVRDAVAACCSSAAFTSAVEQVRSATEAQADLALMVMPLLARLPNSSHGSILKMVFDRFLSDGDPSRFGLMNAFTSLARDTPDPELRWRLEELGGGVPAMRPPARDGSGSAIESAAPALVG